MVSTKLYNKKLIREQKKPNVFQSSENQDDSTQSTQRKPNPIQSTERKPNPIQSTEKKPNPFQKTDDSSQTQPDNSSQTQPDDSSQTQPDESTGEVRWNENCRVYQKGCKSDKIKKVQACLGGIVVDGKFGTETEARLDLKFPELNGIFRDSEIDMICDRWKECQSVYKLGCKSDVIKKAQECLGGLEVDGKFGRETEIRLKQKFPELGTSFRDSDLNKICGIKIDPYADYLRMEPDEEDFEITNTEIE